MPAPNWRPLAWSARRVAPRAAHSEGAARGRGPYRRHAPQPGRHLAAGGGAAPGEPVDPIRPGRQPTLRAGSASAALRQVSRRPRLEGVASGQPRAALLRRAPILAAGSGRVCLSGRTLPSFHRLEGDLAAMQQALQAMQQQQAEGLAEGELSSALSHRQRRCCCRRRTKPAPALPATRRNSPGVGLRAGADDQTTRQPGRQLQQPAERADRPGGGHPMRRERGPGQHPGILRASRRARCRSSTSAQSAGARAEDGPVITLQAITSSQRGPGKKRGWKHAQPLDNHSRCYRPSALSVSAR
jgi:hypothetical protein